MNRVLIVDDSAMLIDYLNGYFKKYKDKFDYITAKDGEEAIEILKKKSISLLVTDLEMPKVDGLDLLAYTNKYHPTISCIVMSAHGTPKMRKRLQPDILQFIEKPFTAEQLAQAILSALNRDLPDGSLSGISTASFLQMVEMEQKTCLCQVDSPNNPKGFFYFKGGVLHHAIYGELKGEKAAIEMIQIDNATISFRKPPDRKIPRRIERPLTAVILEATKIQDESED